MMRRAAIGIGIGVTVLALLAGCSAISNTPSVPPKHPEELGALPRVDCRECHTDLSTGAMKPYASFRHSLSFMRNHGLYARQGQNLCASCHGPSFCQGCHARQEELKPNTRMGERPDMALPHRGDYIVQHQLEGRLDPGSCFRCHGNKNDIKCRSCHK
jgi:hypothetical protein